jgi:hypothetical protein
MIFNCSVEIHLTWYAYTARGELTSWPLPRGATTSGDAYANGAQLPIQNAGTNTVTVDSRMAVVLGTTWQGETTHASSSMTYDAAGRLVSDAQNYCCLFDDNPDDVTITRTYDAENHTLLTGTKLSTSTENGNSIQWGPNGHPILIGSNAKSNGPYSYDTLHWGGDMLLFTTNSAGNLDDIKIGTQGDITPLDSGYKGLTFYDRGPDGGVMGCHNAAGAKFAGLWGYYAMNFKYGNIPKQPCYGTSSMPTSINWFGSPPSQTGVFTPQIGQGGVLGVPRTDGYTDGLDTIQGVRTYDPGGRGVRVCIDAFISQGTVMGVMVGDNRGFERSSKLASSRVEVDISFGKQDGHITLGTSHLIAGGIVLSFTPTNNGSTINVHGNTAVVHINAVVGGPSG